MTDTSWPDRRTPPHILTLMAATATSAMAQTVVLPSLPAIARDFEADYGIVQLLVSLYLVAVAVLQLLIGPVSDYLGRRPVMIACLAIFVVVTLASLAAPNIHVLLACRCLQGVSAAGIVLSRAIVRDVVSGTDAASRMGYIAMGMTVVPMIGPAIGGLLDEAMGWGAVYIAMAGFGALALTLVVLDLGETNRVRSASVTAQFGNYPGLLRSGRFWGYTGTATFASGTFFAFLGGAPFVASETLGLAPSAYGLYFALAGLGYMTGNFISGRFSGHVGMNGMMVGGNLVAAAGMTLSLILFVSGIDHPLSLFGGAAFVGVGNGMTLPSATAGAVGVRPELAGSASGLSGALQIGGGAIMAAIAGALLTKESGPYPLVLVMLATSLAGVLCTLIIVLDDRRRAARGLGRPAGEP